MMAPTVSWKKDLVTEYEETYTYTGVLSGHSKVHISLKVDVIRSYVSKSFGESDTARAVVTVEMLPDPSMAWVEVLCSSAGPRVDFHNPQRREELVRSAKLQAEAMWQAMHDNDGFAVETLARSMTAVHKMLDAKIKAE